MENMTEHERLKRIFDEIGYVYGEDLLYEPKRGFMIRRPTGYYDGNPFCIAKSIEIICTPEFKNAFEKALKIKRLCTEERQNQIDNGDRENYIPDEQIEMQCDYAMFGLLDNLHDPVTYLYNLLFNE